MARAFHEADRLAGAAGELTGDPGAIDVAVSAAILGDRDPATDPDVERALTM